MFILNRIDFYFLFFFTNLPLTLDIVFSLFFFFAVSSSGLGTRLLSMLPCAGVGTPYIPHRAFHSAPLPRLITTWGLTIRGTTWWRAALRTGNSMKRSWGGGRGGGGWGVEGSDDIISMPLKHKKKKKHMHAVLCMMNISLLHISNTLLCM